MLWYVKKVGFWNSWGGQIHKLDTDYLKLAAGCHNIGKKDGSWSSWGRGCHKVDIRSRCHNKVVKMVSSCIIPIRNVILRTTRYHNRTTMYHNIMKNIGSWSSFSGGCHNQYTKHHNWAAWYIGSWEGMVWEVFWNGDDTEYYKLATGNNKQVKKVGSENIFGKGCHKLSQGIIIGSQYVIKFWKRLLTRVVGMGDVISWTWGVIIRCRIS